jgi:hypothetical protein
MSGHVPNPQVAGLVASFMPQHLGYPSRRRRPLDRAGTRFGQAVSACRGLAASRRRHDTFSLDDTGRFVPDRRDAAGNIVTAWVDGTRLLPTRAFRVLMLPVT